MKVKEDIQTKCYHCGDECSSEHLVYQQKDFCCTGCKLVFDILDQNNLCTYYSLESSPGSTGIDFFDVEKFKYLDLKEVSNALIVFKEGDVSKVNFFIPKIHCSSCIWLLENLEKLNEGVNFSRVNFSKKEVSISFNSNITSLRKVVELLAKIGYEPQISLDNSNNKADKIDKSKYIQLGIVAFCFGNMMLLSFPEYISFGQYIESNFRNLFNYLNIAFAIPVFYISIKEYLIPSVKSIQTSQISIDVPIALGILALFFSSIYEILVVGNAGYLDSFGGLIFFLLLGKIFQQKTYDSLSFDRDYRSYFPISVNKVVKHEIKPVTLKSLVIGDEIEIHHQELIPVDSYLKKGKALIDYSFISGESEPVMKQEGDKLYAGGKQVGSTINILVEKEFSQSELINLWNNDAFSKNQPSVFDTLISKISKYFTFAVLFIAVSAMLYWLPQEGGLALKSFVSVLIVACPCALALSSPFALGSVLRVFGKGKFFLKNAFITEKISEIDAIVFDKTGTLTNSAESKLSYEGVDLSESEKILINSVASNSVHPLSKQLQTYFSSSEKVKVDSFEEVIGKGLIANIKGIEIKLGSKIFVAPELTLEGINSDDGGVFISIGGIYKGKFSVTHSYREGILDSIKELSENYKLYVLSGDNNKEESTLKKWFGSESTLLFNQSPQSKLQFVEALKAQGKNVMMIGDGLNDAGALKTSDVGIALTDDVTSFSPSSDGIMDAKSLVGLSRFLKISKAAINIIKISFLISILYNVVGLTMAVQGLLTPVFSAILMPLSSITVVLFTTASVSLVGKYYRIDKSSRF